VLVMSVSGTRVRRIRRRVGIGCDGQRDCDYGIQWRHLVLLKEL
jgi:hypothetical protein